MEKRKRILATPNKTQTGTLIDTDYKAYNTRLKKWGDTTKALDELKEALGEYVEVTTKDKGAIIGNPVGFARDAVMASRVNQNPMNLSYEKLVEVLELDVSKVEEKAKEFAKLNPIHLTAPHISEFEVYAKTASQVERYKALTSIIKSVKKLESTEGSYNIERLNVGLMSVMGGRLVSSDGNQFVPTPNIKYVLTGRAI